MVPIKRTDHKGQQDRHPDWNANVDDQQSEYHAGKAHHGPERQIELACDHQQRHAHGQHDELRRNGAPVNDTVQGEHLGAAGENEEESEHGCRAANCSKLRANERSTQE